ncbi:hydroxyacylglutathione hydrolase [Erythrobacter litoralis]|uniref:Hydroxyacylglutathione hydrolase n=1 Tax=Erythrobacter litoralis (strain HTCC2594) TaxID=314225 RepID=GLO2_ERYLH|nr:hydroxyacylglutathione hydrolase [Erythrobacter litoralis]Q2N9P7.1 RecName: Full=Hydroxyacylglutathione hydrolase; AltName: Full=Glyoxalase II; Short=Glx II [Erythrobacter litoralis HTCC2594]ABC63594.1 hydroxyacylglutathione hydrolase, putative [Erythrobacter litoralis HTCC2594]
MLEIHQFPCLSDNYGFLLHDPDSGETAAIDTPDGKEYLKQAKAKGWTITHIWNTHWHPDHAGGNKDIVEATGAKVIAPQEVEKLSGIDRVVGHGDTVDIGDFTADVIDVSGHTNGHIAYHLPEAGIAFVGDSVFALGCGRMFEGEPKQFWDSLSRIKALPPETMLYCAHEYTAANARFAVHADPENDALVAYVEEITAKRERDEPTVPTQLKRELATNPFLRADDPALVAKWGGDAPHETFAALRAGKDNF